MKYDGHAKDTHGRGWAVNQIRFRKQCRKEPIHDSLALVLGGEDRDRLKLLQRGWQNHNIISVDKETKSVKAVRATGGIAIHADVRDVIAAWPSHTPIDVLLLDYNNGFDIQVLELIALFKAPGIADAALVYLNLQRGRDKIAEVDRAWHQRFVKRYGKHHRAMEFITAYAAYHFRSLVPDTRLRLDQWADRLNQWMLPQLATPYRQRDGAPYMDGCVFSVLPHRGDAASEAVWRGFFQHRPEWSEARKLVTAALAVRTARMRGAA